MSPSARKTSTVFNLESVGEDAIIRVMNKFKNDTAKDKIDVSVGVYKTEEGDPNYVFPCVRIAKQKLAENDPGHCYTQMSGIPELVSQAQKTIFGDNYPNVASVQAISGSGSLHLAIKLLVDLGFHDFYVGSPGWTNYQGMIEHAGGAYHDYNYYDAENHLIDFSSVLEALRIAPEGSVFVLQAVCHNPTGLDLSQEQWLQIFEILESRNLFPLFDIAYQGFSSGDTDADAWAVREAYRQNLEFIACQSYSKNMGLYSERVGCTHVCTKDQTAVPAIFSKLVNMVRCEFSFAPAFGARVAAIVQSDAELRKVWKQDVRDVVERLCGVRQKVFEQLTELKTPGSWKHVLELKGLFWFSGLTPLQVEKLIEEHHIYGTENGRVNIAGLNDSNINKYCLAIDDVVRRY